MQPLKMVRALHSDSLLDELKEAAMQQAAAALLAVHALAAMSVAVLQATL